MHEPNVVITLQDGAVVPAYQTQGAAGADLSARLDGPLTIAPGARAIVPTGVRMQLPAGYEAQVRSRSGLAIKHGVACLNSPGTIDSDYRGEIGVILINHGQSPFVIADGDRIAQLVVSPVSRAGFSVRGSLDESERGSGGFGSTGQ